MKRRPFTALATLATLASLAAAALSGGPLWAQDKPPLKILVGFPAGGSVDIVARLLADKLRVSLAQNVIVENKPGAGGRIAMGELKRAAPDGQTLALTPSGVLVVQPWLFANMGFDVNKDFAPVARVSTFDFAITAGPGAPAGDIKAILAWMKANPAKANYATSGAGTLPHFAGQLLAQSAGITITHVGYKGGAPAAADLIGGQVPLMVDTASETIEHHRAGKVRIVAVTGEARSKSLPDVPTLKESGINVVADGFFGLFGPVGVPADVVARLNRAVGDALRAPDVQEKMQNFGLVANYGNAQELAALQAEHYRRWEAPIKASGFKPE